MGEKVISILAAMLLLCFSAYSQNEGLTDSETGQKTKEIEIYFDLDSYAIDSECKNNNKNLSDLISWLQCDHLTTILKIEIASYASPEGGRSYNKALSSRRSEAMRNFLHQNTDIPDSLIVVESRGIAWELLTEFIEEYEVPYKQEVLSIIKDTPEETWRYAKPTDRWLSLVDSRNKHLMDLRGGRPYRYMEEYIFPQLRKSTIITIIFKEYDPVEVMPIIFEPKEIYFEPLQLIADPKPLFESRPLFAIKTNLLFDAASLINIELELPIRDRWSLAAEWIFPWWGNDTSDNAVQLLNGNLEAKYWFGDRTGRSVLTGWYAGIYTGGGLYDFRRDSKGYIGEFFIAAGVSGGYAHTINKSGNLRMEYSLGIGFLQTDYRYYIGEVENQYWVRQYNGNYTWIGPTRAKVSLSWLLNHKKQVR